MTTARKLLAKGAKISVAISSVQTQITNAKKISPPDDELGMWDSTVLGDADITMEAEGTIKPGKVTLSILFDSKDAVHAFLMNLKYTRTVGAFVITGPATANPSGSAGGTGDQYTFTFSAYVTKCPGPVSEVNKSQEAEVELSLISVATFAVSS